mmetsp:Transcript_53105/g.126354  ORF Transcript_53105/g.126354 Transcript_53105/m.126354 type:complete len:150 (+) Transcript_53105:143-592(+)
MPKKGGKSTGGSSRGSDRNDAGVMTLLEKRMLEKKTSTYLLDPDIKSVFSQFDRDGNGYLGASDLAAVYRSLGEHLDDDLIDELIREADKDGDGQIAYPEFVDLIKKLEEEGGGMRDPNAKPTAGNAKKATKKKDSSSDSGDTSSSGDY